ncbi:MAG: hypothetical protein IKH16_10170 [Selenomonadaceae bacterium]|nr:hypothetical protein [Selenomonadaceae bacterium]
MKKKIASLLAMATMFTAVPAFAATPAVAAGQPFQNIRHLSDNDNNDGWYCDGSGYCYRPGRGHGCGRHDGSCWNNNQNQ